MQTQSLSRRNSSPRSPSVKFLYNCRVPTTDWLWIDQVLHKSNDEMGVLKGHLERKHIVVKFGQPSLMRKEYNASELLKTIPNFMRYYCTFACDETATDLFNRNYATHPRICSEPGDRLGFAMMPFYHMRSINNFQWSLTNLPVLKNALKQVAGAVLNAYLQFGFCHNDLHLDNILLRQTKKAHLSYERGGELSLKGLYCIIMDFEKATFDTEKGEPRRAYETIRKVMYLASTMDGNSDLVLDPNDSRVVRLASTNAPITDASVREVWAAIDGMQLRYEKSKVPRMPVW